MLYSPYHLSWLTQPACFSFPLNELTPVDTSQSRCPFSCQTPAPYWDMDRNEQELSIDLYKDFGREAQTTKRLHASTFQAIMVWLLETSRLLSLTYKLLRYNFIKLCNSDAWRLMLWPRDLTVLKTQAPRSQKEESNFSRLPSSSQWGHLNCFDIHLSPLLLQTTVKSEHSGTKPL